ncbi:hypothetical protein MHEL_59700 [Mycolicibacterium helvum]|uniref:Uncharacterized protein n=1 Tax=Mycolicibacterium helvum TaxID=1534349 RepID=A0A7I7TET1_9MYCO|nr:hypothetical protein MHEL_59700 [Mycolicibacterium helvum]
MIDNRVIGGGVSSINAQLLGSALIGVREGLETGIVVLTPVAFLIKSEWARRLRWSQRSLWLCISAHPSRVS